MTLDNLRLGWIPRRALIVAVGLGLGVALGGPVLFATPLVIGTADASGTITSGEYAGLPFTVHLAGEYSGVGLGTLTSGAGTYIQIGTELFEGIVSPDFGTFQSFCCGNGGIVGNGFFLHGQVRHGDHNHLFDASATTAGALCFNLHDQTGTIVTPAVPPHDPHVGGLICLTGAVVTLGVPVAIDIKPGVFPNTINPSTRALIPVAILSTDDFDATTVDPLSVRFGPSGAAARGSGHLTDVNGDGRLDLLLQFATPETGIVAGSSSASLTGAMFDGVPIQGSDEIVTVGR